MAGVYICPLLLPMLTIRLLGVGGQVAHLEAGRVSHCQGWPWGYAAPPQLLQTLHLQWGGLRHCDSVFTLWKTRWSVSIWAWPGGWTTTPGWSMRRCCLVDLKLGRRLLWEVLLGEEGIRIKASENKNAFECVFLCGLLIINYLPGMTGWWECLTRKAEVFPALVSVLALRGSSPSWRQTWPSRATTRSGRWTPRSTSSLPRRTWWRRGWSWSRSCGTPTSGQSRATRRTPRCWHSFNIVRNKVKLTFWLLSFNNMFTCYQEFHWQ